MLLFSLDRLNHKYFIKYSMKLQVLGLSVTLIWFTDHRVEDTRNT